MSLSEPVKVDVVSALDWARANGVVMPPGRRMEAINNARRDHHLPPFVVVRSRPLQPPAPTRVAEPTRMEPMPMPDPEPLVYEPIQRSTAGLREVLFKELADLRAGLSDPKRAMAVAKIAGSIIESLKVEMDLKRLEREQRAPVLEHHPS